MATENDEYSVMKQFIAALKHPFVTTLALLWLAACSQVPNKPMPALAAAQTHWIGERIFANECNLQIPCLTSWNAGEDFPSLGIGHFIWYRSGQQEAFVESFPALLNFYDAQGVSLPTWLTALPGRAAPWRTKEEFEAEFDAQRLSELRDFLYQTRDIQVQFIVNRMRDSLPNLLAHSQQRAQIESLFYEVANSSAPLGMYALIDYVNFKGEGTASSERYNSQGWGLLQVLETLAHNRDESALMPQFAESARAVLAQRVANAPIERNEQRWLQGWNNRTLTYETLPNFLE